LFIVIVEHQTTIPKLKLRAAQVKLLAKTCLVKVIVEKAEGF